MSARLSTGVLISQFEKSIKYSTLSRKRPSFVVDKVFARGKKSTNKTNAGLTDQLQTYITLTAKIRQIKTKLLDSFFFRKTCKRAYLTMCLLLRWLKTVSSSFQDVDFDNYQVALYPTYRIFFQLCKKLHLILLIKILQ